MLSAQHTSTEVQPAADHALLILYAEGGLGEPNFIHYHSQPSRSTKMFKRAENNINESEVLKVRFGQTTTVLDDRIILIGGSESVEGILPSNSFVLNSTSLNVNEQKVTLPVLGHGAVPIRGSKILITFGIQAIAPQRMFATPIQEIDVNTMNVIPSQFIKGEVPQSRYDHTTTKIDDDKIFIYGGRNKDEVVLGDLFYLDLNSNSWNFINQPSHPIAGHSSILVNNYLISCFGIDANTKVINDCNIFDIFTNTFIQPIINEVPPIPRTLSSMVSFENNKDIICIFGGIDENNNGLNDLYKLDVSKAPTLSWSPIIVNSKTTNNKLIPSGRGAHSAFTIEDTDIMTIWGGISNGNQLVDPNFYFFDIRGNAWVDKNFYIEKVNPAQISLDGIKKPESNIIVVIFGIIGTIILIIGLLGFFIIRKRRLFQKFQKKEINNEPYSQSDQFGSNTYLISDFESKQAQFKIIDEPEPVPEPIPQPIQQIPQSSPTLSSPPTNVEKEPETSNNRQHNDSIISTTPKKMSFGKLPALSNTGSTSETQRMKRSHKRTSSVSLTSSELASITRSRNFTHHKSSLSTNSITSSVNRPNSHHNSRKSLSNFLDTVSEKGSNNRISSTSDRSVNSVQWVGFNSSMIYEQEESRDSLHVRNLPYKQQKNSTKYHENSSSSEDEEYTINGDYIDTSPRVNNNYNRNIFDHDEVIRAYDVSQRKNSPQNYSVRNNIPRQGNIANENISRESGIIDHESPSSSYESSDIDRTSNEDDKYSSMKKSKRSSKGISRVSFALKDEKIEFDENESSSTVSLTRRSLSSQSSTSSSSATPSIIEEEIDIAEPLKGYRVLNNTTNPILNKSYDDESNLSRFSF